MLPVSINCIERERERGKSKAISGGRALILVKIYGIVTIIPEIAQAQYCVPCLYLKVISIKSNFDIKQSECVCLHLCRNATSLKDIMQ